MIDIITKFDHLWADIVAHPIASASIIINLIIIESLLSVDNAAVLATMVKDLPEKQQDKALKYGIWGAYIFRGLAMIFASVLIKVWWLKPLGGIYLLYLVYDWYQSKQTKTHEDDTLDKDSNWFYKLTVKKIGKFWSTVFLVELMDMAFSIDNVFAAVAFTPNILLVCIGVFIGILAMRYIAQWFVNLMNKYNFLETSAFIVIGLLGIKLTLSILEHLYPQSSFAKIMSSHTTDTLISIATVAIFFVPILTSHLFNLPKKTDKN